MAKNSKPASKTAPVPSLKPGKTPAAKVSSTPVRNTPIPKAAPAPKAATVTAKPAATPPKASAAKPAAAPKTITHDDIAKRAYEIHSSGHGGSETDNWHRAERELRG